MATYRMRLDGKSPEATVRNRFKQGDLLRLGKDEAWFPANDHELAWLVPVGERDEMRGQVVARCDVEEVDE